MSRRVLGRSSRIFAGSVRAAAVLYASVPWFFCIVIEVLYVYNGERLRIIPGALFAAASAAYWVVAVRYVRGPVSSLARAGAFILMLVVIFLVFWALLFQEMFPF
jgi:hypothetical protein